MNKLILTNTIGDKEEAQRIVDKYFKDTEGLDVEISRVQMYEEGDTLYIKGLGKETNLE